MIKLLFICHGNICRSPMAEFIMKDLIHKQGLDERIIVASCATSTEELSHDIHPGTKKKLLEESIPFAPRAAVQLTKADYDAFDYLIAMDSNNMRNIRRIINEDNEGKISLLMEFTGRTRDIADPWYTGDFDLTYSDILKGCTALLDYIRARL